MNKINTIFSNKIFWCFIIVILITIVISVFRILDAHNSIKKAVHKKEIKQYEDYIITKMTWVTGFEWELVQEDKKLTEYQGVYCKIKGSNPNDLCLKYDFETADNKYVFYVTDRREFFDYELGENCLEYTVSKWDILYPVKHGSIFEFLKTSNHITKSDIN